jgi:hypothetical protein
MEVFFVTLFVPRVYNPPQLISRFACPNLRESKCSKLQNGNFINNWTPYNITIVTPTKCTLLLSKASDITIRTLCHHIFPLHVSTRVGHLQGAQCQCLAKVIINYNLLKLC